MRRSQLWGQIDYVLRLLCFLKKQVVIHSIEIRRLLISCWCMFAWFIWLMTMIFSLEATETLHFSAFVLISSLICILHPATSCTSLYLLGVLIFPSWVIPGGEWKFSEVHPSSPLIKGNNRTAHAQYQLSPAFIKACKPSSLDGEDLFKPTPEISGGLFVLWHELK